MNRAPSLPAPSHRRCCHRARPGLSQPADGRDGRLGLSCEFADQIPDLPGRKLPMFQNKSWLKPTSRARARPVSGGLCGAEVPCRMRCGILLFCLSAPVGGRHSAECRAVASGRSPGVRSRSVRCDGSVMPACARPGLGAIASASPGVRSLAVAGFRSRRRRLQCIALPDPTC